MNKKTYFPLPEILEARRRREELLAQQKCSLYSTEYASPARLIRR